MRGIFVFVLSLGCLILHGQSTRSLEPNKISIKSNNAFILVKNPPKNLPIVLRLGAESVVVRGDILDDKYSYSEVYEINDSWKIVDKKSYKKSKEFYIRTEKSLNGHKGLTEMYHDERLKISLVEGNSRIINKKILHLPYVTFIQCADRIPVEESILRDHNLGINGVSSGQKSIIWENLDKINISIKEGAFDTLDLDILGRSELGALSSPQVTSHATDMATLVAGKGNSAKEGRGVAEHANLFSESFNSLFPAATDIFEEQNVFVQNHSYGVGIENFYGVESVAFDQQIVDRPVMLHVFSSGNSGESNSTGAYENITQFRTITGSFKQAKNVLVVTGTDDQGDIPDSHSAGPAYDGRIKPELAAYGGGGTSDAAALVSGAAAVISSSMEAGAGTKPSAAMLKSILISSAVDIGAEGPDFKSGFGQMNLRRALEIVESSQTMSSQLADSESRTHPLEIPIGVSELRIALVWNDPPANDGDFMALVHNLDLRLLGDGQEWMPLVLDHRPNLSSLESLAIERNDTLNNVEMISVKNPTSGTYTVQVAAGDLSQEQSYSIAYYLEYNDSFQWDYPTNDDPQLSREEMRVYFTQSFDDDGTLDIDYLDDNWEQMGTIQPSDFTTGLSSLESGEAVLRATFGMNEFKSDTFAIHEKMEMEVALFCEDELVLNWNAIGDNQSYELLQFVGGELQPILTTTDTFAILDRNNYSGVHFTVRPIFQYSKGRFDETVNVSQRGVGCYLNNFLVSLKENDRIELNVDLSLPDRVTALRIVKSDNQETGDLINIDPADNVYTFSDQDLVPGKTTYQVVLEISSGEVITSEEIAIFTTDDKKYILFPNPVTDGQLAFLSPVTGAVFQILDSSGRPLTDYIISAEFEVFNVELTKGIYFYRVIKDGEVVKSGRFAVGS